MAKKLLLLGIASGAVVYYWYRYSSSQNQDLTDIEKSPLEYVIVNAKPQLQPNNRSTPVKVCAVNKRKSQSTLLVEKGVQTLPT